MQESDVVLLEQIIQAIVAKPEKVVIERKVDEMGVLLSVRLDDKDAGALIGRGGETIAAIRRQDQHQVRCSAQKQKRL